MVSISVVVVAVMMSSSLVRIKASIRMIRLSPRLFHPSPCPVRVPLVLRVRDGRWGWRGRRGRRRGRTCRRFGGQVSVPVLVGLQCTKDKQS